MKPRKVIIYLEPASTDGNTQKFLMQTWGYRVLLGQSAADVPALLKQVEPGELSLLLTSGLSSITILNRVKRLNPSAPSIAIADSFTGNPLSQAATQFLMTGAFSQAELRERIRVLCSRRRKAANKES